MAGGWSQRTTKTTTKDEEIAHTRAHPVLAPAASLLHMDCANGAERMDARERPHRQPFPQREIVSFPKAMPRSQPRPLPLNASETSPFVITWAFADFTAPACASAAA